MAFLAQKLIYTINIWFNFVFGSFFEEDHLLNLFISESLCEKMTQMCTYFNTKTNVAQNLIDDFFFQPLTVRGPFHRKDFELRG